MTKPEERLKIAREMANETLDRAEKKGFTLAEVMLIPEVMSDIIRNELARQGTPYKREKPRT